MSRIFIATEHSVLCNISSFVFCSPGRRPWRVRIRDIQHHRRMSWRLQEAAKPGGHGHGNHLHCSGIIIESHPPSCILPFIEWCAQYKAITIVGGDNRIMSRSLNICEHEVIGLNIFFSSPSRHLLTIYRAFTDRTFYTFSHYRSFSSFCSFRILREEGSQVRIRYLSSMNIKLFLVD